MSEDYEDLDREPTGDDKLDIGWQILAFCIPIAGAVMYFKHKDEYPKKAKTACYAALIGMGVGLVLNIITALLGVGAGM